MDKVDILSKKTLREKIAKMCIRDREMAEKHLIKTLDEIVEATMNNHFYMPKIFIRVREPKQLKRVFERLDKSKNIVTGRCV